MIDLLTSDELRSELSSAIGNDREVSEAAARTIASHWQSPGTIGRAFAAWASGADVAWQDVHDDLRAAIRDEYRYASPDAKQELNFLGTYLIHNRW